MTALWASIWNEKAMQYFSTHPEPSRPTPGADCPRIPCSVPGQDATDSCMGVSRVSWICCCEVAVAVAGLDVML